MFKNIKLVNKIIITVGCVSILLPGCLLLAQAPFKQDVKKGLQLYLFIGQSNMSGVADIGSLDTVTLSNVYLFNDKNEWEEARNTQKEGTNRYSTVRGKSFQKLSPAYSFSEKLAKYTNRQVGIISNARGGTLLQWWQKGYKGKNDFDLYEKAISRTKAALATNRGTIKAIIWHQGEGNNGEEGSKVYMELLKQLVKDMRTDLGNDNIPFIAGEVGKWNGRGLFVNPVIRKIADSIEHADYVSSDGLTSRDLLKNDPHFDTYSQRSLGGRYADKALEMIYKISPGGVTLYSGKNYDGRSIILKPGKYTETDLERMGIGSMETGSIKVNQGNKVFLYPGDFNSKPIVIQDSNADLKKNRFSEIRIQVIRNKNK